MINYRMETTLMTIPIIKQIIAIIIIIGANVGYNVLLHYVMTNTLYITLLSYIGLFLSIMVIYFFIFDFTITALFSFILALLVSVLISIFLIIFMSPSYCSADGSGPTSSNVGVYFETFLYGLLLYLMYIYLTIYVMPFYNNPRLPNQLKFDIIFGGMIGALCAIIWVINAYVGSEVFNKVNLYTVLVYVFILSMKIYVIGLQAFNAPPSPQMLPSYPPMQFRGGGPRQKSAFYDMR